MLAAGGSRRLGQPKQLLRRRGESLLHHSVRRAQQSELSVLVVLGCERESCRREVQDLQPEIVENPDWETGMGSSIAHGARELLQRKPPPAMLIALADQPHVGAEHYRRLAQRYRRGPERICITGYGNDCLGAPALFAPELLPELARLSGDQGARMIVRRHAGKVARVPFPGFAFDIDTPQDRLRWERETARR